LIEVSKKLEELEEKNLVAFHIYGSGEDFDLIRQLIESNKLGGQIVLHGADSNARDKLVDGFCYISTSRWEGLPISLLEAMAAGLPVLASNVVGNNDVIIDGENGLLFELNDPKSCAEKILRLASDKKLWESISINARNTVQQKFSIKKMITETEKVYLH
jgi:glycosyltransferase involved in cell wall biosynthesis